MAAKTIALILAPLAVIAGLFLAPATSALASPVVPATVSAILPAPHGLHVTHLSVGRADLAWDAVPGARVYELRIEGATQYDHVLRPGQRSAYALLRPGRYWANVRAGSSSRDVHGHWSTTIHFTMPSACSRACRAVHYAYDQIGCPYVYGATGPCGNGFDCSGLVMSAWYYAGVSLPRTTWSMWAGLQHISRSSLQPGDLVFGNGFGHVMIYVGSGYVIQAEHTGTNIMKSSLSYVGTIDGYARVLCGHTWKTAETVVEQDCSRGHQEWCHARRATAYPGRRKPSFQPPGRVG
jgi:hypothetical protein